MSEFTLVDLFAGAGGLSAGLEMAGFGAVLANELDPQYAQTYRTNHPSAEVVVGDVRKICEIDLRGRLGVAEGEIDLLAGGPPCQGFSINAPIRSLDDSRNHLFRDFLRVAGALLPKVILIENVPGIISLGRGTVVKQIYGELAALGYATQHRILFAAHYGVPQMRFRTILIATRVPRSIILFPEPKYDVKAVANFTGARELCLSLAPLLTGALKPPPRVGDALAGLPKIKGSENKGGFEYETVPKSPYEEYLREGSTSITGHMSAGLGQVNLERMKHIPPGGSWRDIPFDILPKGLQRARRSDHTKRYGRLHPDQLCSTILTKCDPHWGSFFHPSQDRVLSVREAARIQSFQDRFRFTGSVTQQYAQVGNAVPPLMAREIGLAVRGMLERRTRG